MKRYLALLFFVLFFGGGIAWAEPSAPPASDGWQQVDGSMLARGESIPASRLVGAAYGFIFVAMVVWVASVARRARRLEDEVAVLEKKLKSLRG